MLISFRHITKVPGVSNFVLAPKLPVPEPVTFPDSVIVSQKYGEFYINNRNIFHSCGIMYIDDSRIFYCIMTNGLQREEARDSVGILINKIYNYVIQAKKISGILSNSS